MLYSLLRPSTWPTCLNFQQFSLNGRWNDAKIKREDNEDNDKKKLLYCSFVITSMAESNSKISEVLTQSDS
jgi:hypothetical protein